MTEKEKKIMETFREVLPLLNKAEQEYLLGYGDGIFAARDAQEESREKILAS